MGEGYARTREPRRGELNLYYLNGRRERITPRLSSSERKALAAHCVECGLRERNLVACVSSQLCSAHSAPYRLAEERDLSRALWEAPSVYRYDRVSDRRGKRRRLKRKERQASKPHNQQHSTQRNAA